MISGTFSLALVSGMVATVNPCGFAMLPAYLSYFLGLSGDAGPDRTTAAALRRALVVSAALVAGFTAVFTTVGAIIRASGLSQGDFARYARWPSAGIGVALVIVGIALLAGWHLPFATPRMSKGGRDTTLASMFVFGVSYAVTSLSCGGGPFFGTVMGSFTREGFVSGVLVFVMYALGMGLVVSALTISMAVAQQGVLRLLRHAMQYTDRIAGALLVLAGGYLVYYWAFDGRNHREPVANIQTHVESWFGRQSSWGLLGLFGGVVLAALVALVILRQGARRSSTHPSALER